MQRTRSPLNISASTLAKGRRRRFPAAGSALRAPADPRAVRRGAASGHGVVSHRSTVSRAPAIVRPPISPRSLRRTQGRRHPEHRQSIAPPQGGPAEQLPRPGAAGPGDAGSAAATRVPLAVDHRDRELGLHPHVSPMRRCRRGTPAFRGNSRAAHADRCRQVRRSRDRRTRSRGRRAGPALRARARARRRAPTVPRHSARRSRAPTTTASNPVTAETATVSARSRPAAVSARARARRRRRSRRARCAPASPSTPRA